MSDFLRDFLIGGVSAAVSKTAAAPFERVILLTAQTTTRFNSIIRQLKYQVQQQQGLSTLWKGNLANVIRFTPLCACYFAFKDACKKHICPFDPKKDQTMFFLGNMASGGAAGATFMMVIYPLDIVRTRLANSRRSVDRQFNGFMDCLSKVYKSDGFIGLYRGISISILGTVIYRGVYFGAYDTAKETIFKHPIMSNIITKFIVAQFITGTAGVISSPLDQIRRRILISGNSDFRYKNILDCAIKISKNEGIKGFFKGALSNFFSRKSASLVLVLYDEIQQFIAIRSKSSGDE